MMDYFGMAMRISIVYIFTLALLRLTGKRSIGQLSAFDFIVALIIGDLFDDVILSEVPVPAGLVAIGVIIVLHALLSFGSYLNPQFEALVGSSAALIARDGRMDRKSMEKERLPESEVMEAVHFLGEERVKPVRKGFLEPNGQISLLRKEQEKTAQKKDRPQLKDLFR